MKTEKILLVTGASSEVGSELIKRISSNYKMIWTHYCNSTSIVDELKNKYGDIIIPIQADFSDKESTEFLIRQIKDSGNIPDHIVHLSAQKVYNLQFHKNIWDSYQTEIDISLRSITMILQAFIPEMAKQRYGKVIFMLTAYLLGSVSPKFQSPYITVKYALLGLMKNIAAEYAAKGIMANAVSPDMMETKFLSELPKLILEQSAKNNPQGRNIRVEEVVPTIEYLLSPASDIVTGQNIGVTGRQ